MILYTDIDSDCIEWLSRLVTTGQLPPGDVLAADVRELTREDLAPYRQVHLFAGIGGWPLACLMARWPQDEPIWTASCPCQPFSSAGLRKGEQDERHLWPAVFALVKECAPDTIVGEQVESRAGWAWLEDVYADLETESYCFGAVCLPAAGVGAPHQRHRLWWVADLHEFDAGRGWQRRDRHSAQDRARVEDPGIARWEGQTGRSSEGSSQPIDGPWKGSSLVRGHDNVYRPVKPGVLPLADGVSRRLECIRGYGNAIVPQVGAAILEAYRETRNAA